MFKAYKYRLYPTKSQKILLEKHFGAVRYIYNKGLALKIEAYQKDKSKISRYDLQKQVVEMKNSDCSWLREVNAQSLQFALFNLDNAFGKFFKKQANFPRFKSKKNNQSFSCPQQNKVNFDKYKFYCPKFKEGIKTVFSRRFEGKIKTCAISRTSTNKYFVSILVDEQNLEIKKVEPKENKCLGIDLGVSSFATFSDGEKIENPRFLSKKLKKLRKLSKSHSKKKKGSKNREKSRKKLAILHEKITNCRKDFQHKLSKEIADNQSYNCVAMETLNIQGMIKNKRLARHIQDCSWYQFKTMLKYKLERNGKQILEIGRFQPSSKICSCGEINNELSLKDRIWTCGKCSTTHDRDILAANNIVKFAFLTNHLGKGSPDSARKKSVEKPVRVSAKQKVSLISN